MLELREQLEEVREYVEDPAIICGYTEQMLMDAEHHAKQIWYALINRLQDKRETIERNK